MIQNLFRMGSLLGGPRHPFDHWEMLICAAFRSPPGQVWMLGNDAEVMKYSFSAPAALAGLGPSNAAGAEIISYLIIPVRFMIFQHARLRGWPLMLKR